MKTILFLTAAVFFFSTSNVFSGDLKGKDDLKVKQESQNTPKNQDSKTKETSVKVKNIWKDMPSYDRYGNEITARARYNMMQNELINRNAENKPEENSNEFSSNREVK